MFAVVEFTLLYAVVTKSMTVGALSQWRTDEGSSELGPPLIKPKIRKTFQVP